MLILFGQYKELYVLDISQIYENLFILFYLMTICIIGYLLDKKVKRLRNVMDNAWFTFYSISVLFISIPVALIVTSFLVTILMYII